MENLKTKLINLSNQNLQISQFVIFYLKSIFQKTDYLFIPIVNIKLINKVNLDKNFD